jgi:hypothetical protein
MKKTILSIILLIATINIYSQTNIYPPSGNVGIGTNSPNESLHIRTAVANLLVENSGIEGAYINIKSGRFNRPAITSYKQVDKEYWNTGILYDELGNQKYSIGTSQELVSSKFTIQSDGNIGLGTNLPSDRLQIGEINDGQNSKINIPGVYNFEKIKFGQYGNGAGSLEFVNHTNQTESYGLRLYSSTDSGINGLQIQTANPTNSYQNLSYTTRFAININGNVGIGTITPAYKLDVCGAIRAKEVKVDLLGTCVPDFVFKKDYKLMNLNELEKFVTTKQHLPEIASEKEMIENGLNIKEFQMKLLQKVEELTLYVIEQNKQIKRQNQEIKKLKAIKKRN